MDIKDIVDNLDNLSKRDFIRLYLAVSEKYKDMKEENAHLMRNTMWAVLNFDKAKASLNKSRQKARDKIK